MRIPDYRVVILGAGANVGGSIPAALSPIGNSGRLLDWLLMAFSPLPEPEVNFVSGYMAQEVMRQYKGIHFHHNPDWERTGPARSLAVAPLSSNIATYICYSDVVFRKDTVQQMEDSASELVVAIDSDWKVRYDGRSDSDLAEAEKVVCAGEHVAQIGRALPINDAHAEFAGVIRLSGATAKRLENVLSSSVFSDTDGLPNVLNFLLERDVAARATDVRGEWAELNAPQDLARFVLGTKAESLERLRPLLQSGEILDVAHYTRQAFLDAPDAVIKDVQNKYRDKMVIVRSSSLSEDSWSQSAAGAYLSIPDVSTDDARALGEAIEKVYASYGDEHPDNQILVQEMLTDVRMSGVVMTRTHATGAPYYVINYDDVTSRTDTVTSGNGATLTTLFLHRDGQLPEATSPDLVRILETVKELEQLVGHDSLDIEFAITNGDNTFILQVRPIAASHDNITHNDDAIRNGLREAKRFFQELQTPSPFLLGSFTQLSVMADWNPAEIVGTKPTQLAFSVYRYVITDETWATQRAEYGYRDVRPANLLVDMLGHPYVDVRATFNSFCPAALPDTLAERLIEAQMRKLERHPELHDKVEFDVLSTCWHFDIDTSLQELAANGLSASELAQIEAALIELTRAGIARCAADHAALETVSARFQKIRDAQVGHLEKAFLFLENARVNGALHFSHLARAAFVAIIMLRSLVRKQLLTQKEMDDFLASLKTVSTELQDDAEAVRKGQTSWEEFVAKYGHLRPGTYDINSSSYGSAPEEFLRPIVELQQEAHGAATDAGHSWNDETKARITSALGDAGFDLTFAQFESFLRTSIEGREYGKFILTRDINGALESLAEFGADHFIPRRQISSINLKDLLALRTADITNRTQYLTELADRGSKAQRVYRAICLPDQIFSADDFSCFQYRQVVPNFVTDKTVRAEVVSVTSASSPSVDLKDKIVVIPNADPGFDWIFSRDIAGLLTMYGGTNSHMAIRMAEFGLPGATGIGELLYQSIRNVKVVEVDCAGHHIRVVR